MPSRSGERSASGLTSGKKSETYRFPKSATWVRGSPEIRHVVLIGWVAGRLGSGFGVPFVCCATTGAARVTS